MRPQNNKVGFFIAILPSPGPVVCKGKNLFYSANPMIGSIENIRKPDIACFVHLCLSSRNAPVSSKVSLASLASLGSLLSLRVFRGTKGTKGTGGTTAARQGFARASFESLFCVWFIVRFYGALPGSLSSGECVDQQMRDQK